MPPAYRELARQRVATRWPPYLQPEDFGYDFRDWVSPYTKGAHAIGGIAVVLQDWSSVEVLRKGPDPDVQKYGRTRSLRTNRTLESLLQRVLGVSISEVYVTNVFPFVKPGGISSSIPHRDVRRAALEFTQKELAIIRPTITLALGRVPETVLRQLELPCHGLPHPAARIGGPEAHRKIWLDVLCTGRAST